MLLCVMLLCMMLLCVAVCYVVVYDVVVYDVVVCDVAVCDVGLTPEEEALESVKGRLPKVATIERDCMMPQKATPPVGVRGRCAAVCACVHVSVKLKCQIMGCWCVGCGGNK